MVIEIFQQQDTVLEFINLLLLLLLFCFGDPTSIHHTNILGVLHGIGYGMMRQKSKYIFKKKNQFVTNN